MLLLTSGLTPGELGHCSGYMVLVSTFVLRLLVWFIDQNNAQTNVGIAFTGQRTPMRSLQTEWTDCATYVEEIVGKAFNIATMAITKI